MIYMIWTSWRYSVIEYYRLLVSNKQSKVVVGHQWELFPLQTMQSLFMGALLITMGHAYEIEGFVKTSQHIFRLAYI